MPKPRPGAIRRVILENIQGGDHQRRGSIISGIPGHVIQDVILRDIHLTTAGGGTEADAARVVPELIDAYPDAFSFGKTVPAYGFWIRHAERISFERVSISPKTPDARPCFITGQNTSEIILPAAGPSNGALP